ncbi:inositol phosphatase [Agrobacterium vitis]|uniref:inositol monophosphatase family protein n=1 Tax=Agrobacterium vitis TaxID=373 RepID=UPI0012E8026D|nr:inositol monophosphatase family protein [Agrobacterium vitis]MVA19401.1 inositol phosphatase [Agrobacterium vitis]
MNDLTHYLNLALQAARGAGDIINDMRFSPVSRSKADGTIVTDADTAAETYIRDFFSKNAPRIPVWGEEFGREAQGADYEWIIDPIDGTTWYEMGSPVFGTLIGLLREGEPVVGVIALPATNEIVFAAQGGGCFYSNPRFSDPRRVRVSSDPGSLSNARVSSAGLHRTDIWLEKGPKPYALSRLPTSAKLFRLAGDCLQHALVARGNLHAAIDTAMHPWDTAAIVPCIQEAGGYLCGIEGQTTDIVGCGSLLSACSPQLLDELVNILAPGSSTFKTDAIQ